MEKWKKRSIELLTSLAFGDSEGVSVVPYYPQKTRVSEVEENFFPRTTPEKKGISSIRLYNMLCELEGDNRANIHSLMVLCGKEVICECYAEGYCGREWHISHSMSKTVCGMVIGRLVDAGIISVDDYLVDIFPEIPFRDKRFPLIQIDHLLSMTAGVDFAEAGSITESEWTGVFFSSPMRFSPGEKFFYNSMNSYILAKVAERASGRSFGELCREYIFSPLEIENYLWEMGPEGTEKGGWGLYMSVESWAKLGVMLLNDGTFFGKRVLSSEWVEKATTVKAIAPKEDGNFNYAYQMWVGRDSREILFNGMFGQNVWICPKNNIVVVTSCGNNELFQASYALEIIRKHLGGVINDRLNRKDVKLLIEKQSGFYKTRMWAPPLEKRRTVLDLFGIAKSRKTDKKWAEIFGSYKFVLNNGALLPMIIRGMQNNMDGSLNRLVISQDGEDIIFSFESGNKTHTVAVGLYGHRTNVLDFNGEKYIVRAIGRAITRADSCEYRVEMAFSETSSTRRLVIRKKQDMGIEIELSEIPGKKIFENFLKRTANQGSKMFFMLDLLEKRIGTGSVSDMIKRIFNPVLIGVDERLPNCDEIINTENEKKSESSARARLIRAVLDRLFKEK